MQNQYPVDKLYTEFLKDVDNEFTDFIHNLPSDLFRYIKSKVFDGITFLNDNTFEVQLVVDTNIIFSEVRSLIVNNSSFFLKIADNPFIKIYAPTQLKDELYEKIKIKFPKDKKTKDVSIEDCLAKADIFLSKIIINDNISTNSWDKASNYIVDRDPKDVSFVALNLAINGHGILTNDKDIRDQSEIKTWALKDAGQVVTEMNKGTFSLVVLNLSLPGIWQTIYEISLTFWSAFIEIIQDLIKVFFSIIERGVSALSSIPPKFALIFSIVGLIILSAESLKNQIGDVLAILWTVIKDIIRKIKDFFKIIWETLKEIVEALRPLVNMSMQLIAYFVLQSIQAIQRMEQLEKERPI